MPRTSKESSETTKKTTKKTTQASARKTTGTTAKKSSATATRTRGKKVLDKEQAGKYMSRVPRENVFWCTDGAVLNDMMELRDALNIMSDQTFSFHSNEIKQDFAVWIREIIGDEELADELESASTRQEAARMVENRCSLLSEQAS